LFEKNPVDKRFSQNFKFLSECTEYCTARIGKGFFIGFFY